MHHVKNGDEIYVYATNNDGKVLERKATVISRSFGKPFMLVAFPDGQRMAVTSRAGELYRNVMWSSVKQMSVYIELMIETLLKQRAEYQDRIRATNKRITMIKECGYACGKW